MKKLLLILAATTFIFNKSVAQTVTLTASNYNGYNINCFGSQTGTITATVTGGTPPYTYRWSNNATTNTLNNIPAGYYSLEVDDADPFTDVVIEEITLTQPEPLNMGEMLPYKYLNGFNVSAYGACNGSITTYIDGGVLPYTYQWEPGQQTVLSPTNLCANENILIVTDANGCQINQGISLSEPERDDWTMNGNYNSNPATQFIGTLDNKDLTFKTNNTERFKIMANGDIKVNSFATTGDKVIMSNSSGTLFTKTIVTIPVTTCLDPFTFMWQYKANPVPGIAGYAYTCWNQVGIGTDDPQSNLGVKGSARFFNFNNHSKYVDVGNDGLNGMINSTDDILINHYSGKNVTIGGTGGNSNLDVWGKVTAGGFKLNGVGAGLLSVDASGDFTTTPIGNTGLNLWSAIGNDIYNTNSGNIGIGSASGIDRKLVVAGEVRILADANDANNSIEFKSNNGIPTRRGFSIGQDVSGSEDGSFNFWIHGWQNTPAGASSFNFKNSENGGTMMSIKHDGKIGINTTEPSEAFQIGDRFVIHDGGSKVIGYNYKYYGGDKKIVDGFSTAIYFTANGDIEFKTSENLIANSSILWAKPLKIFNDGYVSIGTDTYDPDYILNVCGNIKAEKFLIDADWCDYVFDKEYPLKSIPELEDFIIKHKHLPNIPSQKEVESKGIEVSEMLKLQMEKIEELSLYIIELNKEINKLKILSNKSLESK
ncbi:MAG TPA: SprB repeat-containing protein [Bacteroidia bacterium]|nr:SprB repeat-containing protein [Bacteroidia bacterium]